MKMKTGRIIWAVLLCGALLLSACSQSLPSDASATKPIQKPVSPIMATSPAQSVQKSDDGAKFASDPREIQAKPAPPRASDSTAFIEYRLSSQYGALRIYGLTWGSQIFTAPENYTAQTIGLRVWKTGNPASFILNVYSFTREGLGDKLATVVVDATNLPSKDPGEVVEIATPLQFVSGNQYIIMVSSPDGNGENHIRWAFNTDGGGSYYQSLNAGEKWYQSADRDFVFGVW